MMLEHRFVKFMPDVVEDGILYISLDYGTVIHNCACGCGNQVNTPLSPTGWNMIYNGRAVTLKPSIGNWSFDCRSHYWITNGKVEWALTWSNERVKKVRESESKEKEEFYKEKEVKKIVNQTNDSTSEKAEPQNKKWWFYRFLSKLIYRCLH